MSAAGCRPATPTTPAGSAPTNSAPSAAPAPSRSAADVFEAVSTEIPPEMAAEMTGKSWRPGCPVPLSDLRLVRLKYRGFDGASHQGELIVHVAVAPAIVRIFGKLFEAGFPIRKMRRIDAYGGDDFASMADDNTSMFNCRKAYGSAKWSVHAYGKAIDVNTVENPYLPGNQVLPPAGSAYLDRHDVRPGMVVAGDVVVRAFAAEGFRWGGYWTSGRDYQHFEVSP